MDNKYYRRILGVRADASDEEIEARCDELVDFLRSPHIPRSLRGWARQQRALIEEAYNALTKGRVEPAKEQARRPLSLLFFGRERVSPAVMVLFGLAAGALIGVLALVVAPWAIRTWRGAPPPTVAIGDSESAQYIASQQKTIDQLKAVVAKDPTNKQALFDLGEIYITGGDWESTLYWFSGFLELEPNNAHALTDLGTANFNLNRYDKAKEFWERALAIDPNDVQANYNMGYLYAFASPQDLSLAIKQFETVIRLAPDSELANTAKAHLETLQGGKSP